MGDMLKTLTRRSFAANRLRSLITALAIALVAMLFTSVTTIAMGSAESVKRIMQIQKMSKSLPHCQVKISFFLIFHTRNLVDVL